MNSIIKTLIALLASAVLLSEALFPAAAVETEASDLTPATVSSKLRDGAASTYETFSEITLSAENDIRSVYIVFRSQAVGFTVACGGKSIHFDGGYLQYFADISDKFIGETKALTVTLDETVAVCDIFAFGQGTLPEYVHNWAAPYEAADLLLFTSHADDEQLFFAGILPYYAGELGYRVQVAYFTDHINTPGRRHELLNGLWTVGIRNYPVISEFPDEYSESYDAALYNLQKYGFTEDDVIAYQTELLRRFKPLVAVGHDLEGEYGHGQHKLNSATLTKAVELASNAASYPDSANEYGTWDTPKLYLHLYKENQITMDWDTPLQAFGGKTAFQVTQDGFQCHKSQHYTWFNTWLNGSSGTNTTAASIRQHSPCQYGLYRTTVGSDIRKNDFFENITIYAEQERIAAEEEANRLEEEKQRAEEESRRAEEEIRKLAEEAAADTAEPPSDDTDVPPISPDTLFIAAVAVAAIIAIAITIAVMKRKNNIKRKRRFH